MRSGDTSKVAEKISSAAGSALLFGEATISPISLDF
jgi:ribonuclease BN (tRNA processing enzyme)